MRCASASARAPSPEPGCSPTVPGAGSTSASGRTRRVRGPIQGWLTNRTLVRIVKSESNARSVPGAGRTIGTAPSALGQPGRRRPRGVTMNESEAPAEAVLASLNVRDLLERLSSSAPVPGGGSAAALAGAMGASLVSMVAALTVGREAYVQVDVAAREIGQSADSLRKELVDLAEQDSAAYRAFVSARGLPRETDAQRAARASAMQDASKRSTEAPLRTARVAREALELARRI